ncbi:MAG: hypothetical protein AAF108_02945 [Planctomycetota bacterium]
MSKKELGIVIKGYDSISPVSKTAIRGIKNLQRTVQKLGTISKRSLGGLSRQLTSLPVMITGVAGAFAAGRFVQSLRATTQELDRLNKLSGDTQLTAEQLSTLAVAADRSGVSFGEVEQSLAKFQKRFSLFVQDGSGAAARAFPVLEQLGVSLREVDGSSRAVNRVFDDTVTALGSIEDSATKASLSFQLFGDRTGQKVNRFLADYPTFAKEASALGVRFTQEQLDISSQFVDAQGRVADAFKGVKVRIVEALGQDAVDIVNKFAFALAKVPEIVGKIVKTIDLAFDPVLGEETRQKIQELVGAMGKVVVEGILGVAPLVFMATSNVIEATINSLAGYVPTQIGRMLVNSIASGLRIAGTWANDNLDKWLADLIGPGMLDAADNLTFASDIMAPSLEALEHGLTDVSFRSSDFADQLGVLQQRVGDASKRVPQLAGELVPVGEILADINALIAEMRGNGTPGDDTVSAWKAFKEGIGEVAFQFEELDDFTNQLGSTMAGSFANNAASAFLAFQDGSKKAKEAFKDFAGSVLRDIQTLAIRAAILNVFTGIGIAPPSSSGGANTGGVANRFGVQTSGIRRFNRGSAGVIPGPPVNRDRIPALVTPGERILSRAENRQYERGGGSPVNINVQVDARGAQSPTDIGDAVAAALVRVLQQRPSVRASVRQALA